MDWSPPQGVTFLNHGSFGLTPPVVTAERERWSRELASQPMEFYLRRWEDELAAAMERMAAFVGTAPANLVFMDNATFGMNVVTATLPLAEGDEVLLTDHEYGAVNRIWRKHCDRVGAKFVTAALPETLEDDEAIVEAILGAVTERTRLIVVSHVTSVSALILPMELLCRRARGMRVPVCIDGPHAVAMLPVDLDAIGCDFYAASCHKWLSGPLGSGFLYVAPRWQSKVRSPITSWGGSVSGREPVWQDELNWLGTRDPAPFLAIPAALDFLEEHGLNTYRERGHALAELALERLARFADAPPMCGTDHSRFGTMVTAPLPPSEGDVPEGPLPDPLQDELFDRFGVVAPITKLGDRRFVRVSCHLYNDERDIERLESALEALLSQGA